jgi:hypothetical protein
LDEIIPTTAVASWCHVGAGDFNGIFQKKEPAIAELDDAAPPMSYMHSFNLKGSRAPPPSLTTTEAVHRSPSLFLSMLVVNAGFF